MEQAFQHHGILGQKWGVRRTPEQLGHLSKKDSRWVAKKSDKITAKAKKQSQRELNKYSKELMREPGATNKNGQLSAKTINAYNRRMAELMSTKVSDLRSPSGKVVTFVAKRGEVGVFMALADEGYNMQQLRNGVYDSGRVAYKKDVIDKVEHSAILHHGVKGQKWGVRNGPPYPLKQKVEKAENGGIIKNSISGHSSVPKQGEPNSITDHLDESGKVDVRAFYDDDGWRCKDIHTDDHGNPKHHPFGSHGEHVHEYSWDKETGNPTGRTTREISEIERKENQDIL